MMQYMANDTNGTISQRTEYLKISHTDLMYKGCTNTVARSTVAADYYSKQDQYFSLAFSLQLKGTVRKQ